ncbi:minor capsid protein [Tissierella sp.]|uniref:minor capsid protein n=1 Tax=Tissierella sp. TaxID=41274 RepID=UPI0028B069F5|nr:minor capsid protein [Tissierella sp.]
MLKELEKEILKIRIELEKTSNKEVRKILIEQKKYLERLRREIGSMYMEYGEELHMSSIEKFNTRRKFENELKDMYKGLSPLEVGIVGSILYGAYKESYYKTSYTIDKGLSIGINYKILRKEFIDTVVNADFQGQNFSSRIWKNKEWLVNKLYGTIGKGIYEGYSVDKMSKEIKDIFGSSAYQSKRLVNSELARVVTNASEEIYRNSEVVQKVIWIATLDKKTNPEDGALDGGIWDLEDISRPKPPLHPNCRCAIAPYLPDWSPTTRRDNITKENIPYQNYSDWAKSKGIS